MQIRIMFVHPISNPRGPECWDGKVHDVPHAVYDDIRALAKWIRPHVGFKPSFKPGHSREQNDGRFVFFPGKYTAGVHCVWVEEVK